MFYIDFLYTQKNGGFPLLGPTTEPRIPLRESLNSKQIVKQPDNSNLLTKTNFVNKFLWQIFFNADRINFTISLPFFLQFDSIQIIFILFCNDIVNLPRCSALEFFREKLFGRMGRMEKLQIESSVVDSVVSPSETGQNDNTGHLATSQLLA